MSSTQKVIIVGNLGQDPEVRSTNSGSSVANISVATSESWTDKNTGQKQEKTEWHRIVFFGKLADIAGQYLRKGSKVYVEGKLRTNKWQDQQGNDRYTTEIHSHEMKMLDSKGDNQGQAQAPASQRPPQSQVAPQQQAATQVNQSHFGEEEIDEDIPF